MSGQIPDLPEAALIASGVTSQGEMKRYLYLFRELLRRALPHILNKDEAARLEGLFRWLWSSKPRRYRQGGNFRFTDVLEAQINPGAGEVGNCLGLTVLYNSLAQRLGIGVQAVYLEEAFREGLPHVLSLYRCGQVSLDIEHVLAEGFGYTGHSDSVPRTEWGNRELLADIYHSRGNMLFEKRRFEAAVELYDKALQLNPGYTKARLNTGLALLQLGRNEAAARFLQGA